METYKWPDEDPKRDVWDYNNQKWTYDPEAGRYSKSGSFDTDYTWYTLINHFGPLTDFRVPSIGETFNVKDGDVFLAQCMTDRAVFANGNAVCVRVGRVFQINGSEDSLTGLYPSTWTRLR